MSNKWLQPGSYDDTLPVGPSAVMTAFVQGQSPFNSESMSRLVTLYRSMMRVNELLRRETERLMLTMELPGIKKALPQDAAVQINMLATTFVIVGEQQEMTQACTRYIVDQQIDNLARVAGEIASQIVLMGRLTYHALRGMIVDVDAVDDAHEIVAVSAQRIKHLIDELLSILPTGDLH